MGEEIGLVRLRAAFDLAIEQLVEDSQLLEAAGFTEEADNSQNCAAVLMGLKAQILRRYRSSLE